MTEAVRLVIWDLDETFWSGTLTEGGIQYQRLAHDIVIELAGRGIMSSICSKNDFDEVRKILTAQGIWDHFIFPSINWLPKGYRLAQLIEDTQLRAPTVMFIEDNAMNRNEALHFVPDLQVADPTILQTILADPRFQGSADPAHERLAHYKLLEHRRTEQAKHRDNLGFLRASDIRVLIDHDVEGSIDRAIELINRTNQLNFTKRRLPEDTQEARKQLRQELRERNVQAGLVRVIDKYGDHGLTGIYLLHVHSWRLVHFCFSCRTIGMGVERWLYDRLKRPAMAITGEVQVDLSEAQPPVDWINTSPAAATRKSTASIGRVFARGGCEIQAIAHYAALEAQQLTTEFAFDRGGLPVPIHHTAFLRAAIEGITAEELSAASQLGYEPPDFKSRAVDGGPFDAYIYSFWADGHYALYRDSVTSFCLPFGIHGVNNGLDLRQLDLATLQAATVDPALNAKLQVLRGRFEYLQWSPGILESTGGTVLERNLRVIFSACPKSANVFVLLGCEQVYDDTGRPNCVPHLMELNRITRRAAREFENVNLIAPDEFMLVPADVIDATHWDRHVYFRIYRRIAELHAGGID